MPLKTLAQQQNIPLTFTLCFLLVKKFLIQSVILKCILDALSLLIIAYEVPYRMPFQNLYI